MHNLWHFHLFNNVSATVVLKCRDPFGLEVNVETNQIPVSKENKARYYTSDHIHSKDHSVQVLFKELFSQIFFAF